MTNLIATAGTWWVFGSEDSESGPSGTRYFNSAFLFDPRGRYAATYRKRHLVIFGEYVPFERWLPFLRHLTPIGGSFATGDGPGWFHFGDTKAQGAPMICFEDTFAHSTREHVTPETDFILDLTNNGWFGHGGAQWQHTVNAVFRAVENRVAVVRCTNDGLTCWIDDLGRIRDLLRDADGSEYGAGFRVVGVPLRAAGIPAERTFYNRHGDVFGWGCVAISAVALARAQRRSWQKVIR
jgi:apolipoprotein N-acyltransferase